MDERRKYPDPAGLDFITLIAPTTDPQRAWKLLRRAMGFVDYISVAGGTGTAVPRPDDVQRDLHARTGGRDRTAGRRCRFRKRAGPRDRRGGGKRRPDPGGRLDRLENPGLVIEDSLLSKNGEQIPVEIRAAKTMIEGRDFLLRLFRDITERKPAQETLKRTLDQLESWVRERTVEREETNTTLRVLLAQRDDDQKSVEQGVQSNIHQPATPFLSKLRAS